MRRPAPDFSEVSKNARPSYEDVLAFRQLCMHSGDRGLIEGFVEKWGRDVLQQVAPRPDDLGAIMTPLHLAVKYNSSHIVRCLLDLGADVDVFNTYGQTPLHLAAQHNKLATAEILILKGADLSIVDQKGRTAWSYALEHKSYRVISLLREDPERRFARLQAEEDERRNLNDQLHRTTAPIPKLPKKRLKGGFENGGGV